MKRLITFLRHLLDCFLVFAQGREWFPDWARARQRRSALHFWVEVWDRKIREGSYWNEDIQALLGDVSKRRTYSYEERRWHEARAQVTRVLKEAQIEDVGFFQDKALLEIGPGLVGLLEASEAGLRIGIDPLASDFQRLGLLLPDSGTIYLTAEAENIPLLDETIDVVVARNSLDHVQDPQQVIKEVKRILTKGGHFLLNVDIEHAPTIREPHSFKVDELHRALQGFRPVRELVYDDRSHGERGRMFVGLYRKVASRMPGEPSNG